MAQVRTPPSIPGKNVWRPRVPQLGYRMHAIFFVDRPPRGDAVCLGLGIPEQRLLSARWKSLRAAFDSGHVAAWTGSVTYLPHGTRSLNTFLGRPEATNLGSGSI